MHARFLQAYVVCCFINDFLFYVLIYYRCIARKVIYQPYAVLRNIAKVPHAIKSALLMSSNARQATVHAVANQLFLQTGAVIIPRSTKNHHMAANILQQDWKLSTEEMTSLGWDNTSSSNEFCENSKDGGTCNNI